MDGDVGRVLVDDGVVAEWRDHDRLMLRMEGGDGGRVHVVVVVVGDENGVDLREVGESDSGWIVTARAECFERADAIGPDGIDEDVDAGGLDEKRGVADVGDAKPVDVSLRF